MPAATDAETPWPTWPFRRRRLPAQVWIHAGIVDPDLLQPGGIFHCSAADASAPVEPGVGTLYLHDAAHRGAEAVSAPMRRRGPMALRRAWFAQARVLGAQLAEQMAALAEVLEADRLTAIPIAAHAVEDTAALLIELVAKLGGWIAIEGGPVDPLCAAWDAEARQRGTGDDETEAEP